MANTISLRAGSASMLPANRVTTWNPGLNAVGGIPNRTTIFTTLSPSGGDDTALITNACNTCPPGQVVQLSAGTFNINGNGIGINNSNFTLRGAGPGTGSGAGTLTKLTKADYATNINFGIMYIQGGTFRTFASSTDITGAVKGSNSCTVASAAGLAVGQHVLIDMQTFSPAHPDVHYQSPEQDTFRGFWIYRNDRSLSQIMRISDITGTTITFETPFHIDFPTAFSPQLSRFASPMLTGVGIEDIYLNIGGNGDAHGAINFFECANSWVKHCEGHMIKAAGHVQMWGCYRCEIRDSYFHESPNPTPGGDGYCLSLNCGSSECLIENCIMWNNDKVIVMRGTGGGNVLGYCYTDDAYGFGFPDAPEAGINAGHYTTPHMELLEGNYSHNYQGDTFWGNSIYITVFRNHLSALRAAHPPLDTFVLDPGGGSVKFAYKDLKGRAAVRLQAYQYYTNFVGNILGFSGQPLVSETRPGFDNLTQTAFAYEDLSSAGVPDFGNTIVPMWTIGASQSQGPAAWIPHSDATVLREGNWDWFTASQRWHGIGGAVGASAPRPIPNSLYLKSKPAFFGSNPWPWVNPATGTTTALPAKVRFDAGTPNG